MATARGANRDSLRETGDTCRMPSERTSLSPARRAISQVPYLPGLDGVRALAVVAVMLYHAGVSWMPGGFLGVEVFFVISGYLITLLLIAEQERTGKIALFAFYKRRIRRLLPAVIVMIAGVVAITALFPYMRPSLARTRWPSFWGLFYGSNWYQIFTNQSYADNFGRPPLLRHLWSLAVEEQYYVVWPIVMIIVLKVFRERLVQIAALMTCGAFIASIIMFARYDPYDWNEVYLGTHTRASGLLLGAALALVWRPYAIARSPLAKRGRLLSLIGIVGFLVLVTTTVTWHLQTVSDGRQRGNDLLFRGGFLIVGFATLAVIASATHLGSVFGQQVLGNKAFAWLGTRSYGLYLWHFPIFQLLRPGAIDEGGDIDLPFWPVMLIRMVITFVIAEFSFRFVEQPVRQKRVRAVLRAIAGHVNEQTIERKKKYRIAAIVTGVLSLFVGFSVATAKDRLTDVEAELLANQDNVQSAEAALGTVAKTVVPTSPPSTAPGQTTTTVPATTTTVPRFERLAIGDSVMLGAAEELQGSGFWVDAVVGRQVDKGLDILRKVSEAGAIGDVVLIHLGNNGPATQAWYDEMAELTKSARLVLVFTVRVPKPWQDENNGYIYNLNGRYPNVRVIDWNGLSGLTEGVYYGDGTHLTPEGQLIYAQIVNEFIDKG
jgi:peptidoglycan/LPS O-acetylase OafA/YrhL